MTVVGKSQERCPGLAEGGSGNKNGAPQGRARSVITIEPKSYSSAASPFSASSENWEM